MSVTESVEKNKIIFGPIHSRRFGVSLGVDLSPSKKQCNFDCLYCELSPAPPVAQQSEVVGVESIVEELQKHLNENIDVITLTANGEPTLYPYLGELIDAIETIKGEKETLILSNSASLTQRDIFDALLKLDQVKLSLDAVTPEVFKRIDRPVAGLAVENIVEALKEFSRTYSGKLFIEILFVRGLNDTPEEIARLNEVLLEVDATRIDIGTIDRPPAYPVEGLSFEELHVIAMEFDSSLPLHIASRIHAEAHYNSYTKEEILNTLDKRPLTYEDVELLFDEESKKRLQQLIDAGEIVEQERSKVHFLVLRKNLFRKRGKAKKK